MIFTHSSNYRNWEQESIGCDESMAPKDREVSALQKGSFLRGSRLGCAVLGSTGIQRSAGWDLAPQPLGGSLWAWAFPGELRNQTMPGFPQNLL